MTDAEREAMLGERICRLLDVREYGEAAELLGEYCEVRRRQGKLTPAEDRQSPCAECEERDGCEDAWEVSDASA